MSAAYAVAAGLHLFSVGLVVGFMAITLWALIPAQHLLDGAGYATMEAGMNRVLQPLMPVLLVLALLSGLAATVLAFAAGLRAPGGSWPRRWASRRWRPPRWSSITP